MKPNILIEKTFETPIGSVSCGICSDKSDLELIEAIRRDGANATFASYLTAAHQIEVEEADAFSQVMRPLYMRSAVSASRIWRLKIWKVFDSFEDLTIFFRLVPTHKSIENHFDSANDHVDVLSASHDEHVLYLGKSTDDEIKEMFADSGCLTKVTREKSDFYSSFKFTKPEKNGVKIPIPFLTRTNVEGTAGALHFKFIAAYGSRGIKTDNTMQIFIGLI